jgi:hypothetical protein
MTTSQPSTEHSVYLNDIAEDFFESVKNEPVLVDAIDRILTPKTHSQRKTETHDFTR